MFALKLGLVDGGRGREALELEEVMAGVVGRVGGGVLGGGGGGNSSKMGTKKDLKSSGEALDIFLQQQISSLHSSSNSGSGGGTNTTPLTMHERSLRRKILKEFASACSKCLKCQNCGGYSPKIRHDQFNKLFQVGMPKKNLKVSELLFFECMCGVALG